jgi:glutamyl-tRNA synthetase
VEQPNAHDGRYAPSPTGDLHLGNLRTALAAWLFARSAGARFTMRIDDLDPDRVRPGIAERQLADLAAIGLDWDGEPVYQTARLPRYEAALAALAERDMTYPCFCSRADIRAAASAPHGDGPELAYPGTCAHLDRALVAERLERGDAHCLRVRASGAVFEVVDRIAGRSSIVVDDFVVRRKDEVPAYLLATTVDDHDLRIGEVVRGADLLSSAPRQVWLAAQLDLRVPRFAHVPLVLGADGARLAKRHGAVTLRDLEAAGTGVREVSRWLAASLGVTVGDDAQNFELARSAREFDPGRLPDGPATITGQFQPL